MPRVPQTRELVFGEFTPLYPLFRGALCRVKKPLALCTVREPLAPDPLGMLK